MFTLGLGRHTVNDLVSIITPSYNTASYIASTIESVLNQTYVNWEMIIVDDCSTDNTDDVVAMYLHDKRIKYLKNKKNSGAAVARNYALREAKGKWIAFLDSDDIWLPQKLEIQISFMKKNNYAFSYTNYSQIDEYGNSNGKYVTGPRKITRRKMFDYNWLGCLTVMYDATVIGLIQIADLRKNNDYAMWLRVCKKSDCYLLNKDLARYRIRSGSVSRISILNKIKLLYKMSRNAMELNCFLSFVNVCRNLFYGSIKKILYEKKSF